MSLDFDLYDGKKYSDLVKDIVKNHKAKQNQIKALTDQLVNMVSEPGDAVVVVPLIKGYLDSDIKNDEALANGGRGEQMNGNKYWTKNGYAYEPTDVGTVEHQKR